ncbi:FAS1-like dehydratase domain-containing protein [Cryptosporangium aurantiacum]|uniref:N-terminal half of MaoC dehydratase n=1 Tax=Cryptosporangium aurantiacum TaxID=134849 RepID=A0A1M7PLM2_9ACTN|nr:MaoC family dehydratase N-terminal domain-containing protein [Cryptosporangium aurantiacum]SHN18038.1 N-terminal half of MaoC dehydratase [Cryptosporangium aurantiacum]
MGAPVGTEGAGFELVVERGKIREFAAAMQCEDPAYHGADAIVPPTFLASAVLWAPSEARVEVGFERRRLLHGEQEYVFHGPPPHAGQVLRAVERIVDRYEKPGRRGGQMRFAVVVTEYRDESGELVAEARATYIERAAA